MPLYETSEHLAEEELLKREVEQARNCKLEKLPMKYSIDYAVCRGSKNNLIEAFVELKRRNALSTDSRNGYDPVYMLDIHKIREAQQLWDTYGKPVWLVVKFNDRTLTTPLSGGDVHFRDDKMIMGGRKDRDDQNDHQPFVMIPLSRFKPLS